MSNVDRDLAVGNQMVDEAAQDAGRNPGEIRRIFDFGGTFSVRGGGLVSGDPERRVEWLARLGLEQGIGTFILISSDPATIERFGGEVAQAGSRSRCGSTRRDGGEN